MSNFYTNLANRGALLIRGPDSQSFLQGQTTCDIEELNEGLSVCGAYCTPQGRMVCDFRIIAIDGENYLLSMHRGLCEETAATFGKYIVFSKAELSDASEDWCQFAAWGDETSALLGLEGGRENTLWNKDGVYWVQADAAGTRFEALVEADRAGELSQSLQQNFETAGEAAWELAEIEAGIGHVAPETLGQFLPQMLNYQATGRISFSKGCYTGQEVVARMHYRGKLKNSMHLASVKAQPCPAGTVLFRQGVDQGIGTVVNAASAGDSLRILAMVRMDALEVEVRLGSQEGPVLEFLELPYSLDSTTSG